MQSSIFVKVAPLLREKKPDIDCSLAIDFLNRHHSGEWIYPKAMKGVLHTSMFEVYEILELCVDEGLADQNIAIYCPNCQRLSGNIYKTVLEVPEEIYCKNCDQEIENPAKFAIVIYRVR